MQLQTAIDRAARSCDPRRQKRLVNYSRKNLQRARREGTVYGVDPERYVRAVVRVMRRELRRRRGVAHFNMPRG